MSRMTTATAPVLTSPASILGYHVQRLRLSNGWTQHNLATRVASVRTMTVLSALSRIAAIEKGRVPEDLGMSWLRAFAEVFEVTYSELLDVPSDL